jgi:hypothetical protein
MDVLATTTWPDVGVALVVALPGLLSFIVAMANRKQLRTPSGDTIGELSERTHDITHATNLRVNLMDKDYRHDHDLPPQRGN